MKTNQLTYKVPVIALLLLMVLWQGCSKDPVTSETELPDDGERAVMLISTRANSSDPDDAIRTLRLFIFAVNSDGTSRRVLNKLLKTSEADDANTETSNSFKSYFIKGKEGDEDKYQIAEILTKETVKVILVANELTDMSRFSSIDDIRNSQADFYDTYGSSGLMNINITGLDGGNNQGYIPMYAESGLLAPNAWDASNGKTVDLNLIRILSKVTVQLKVNLSADVANNGTLSIKGISIIRAPKWCVMGNPSEYSDNILVSTNTQSLPDPGLANNETAGPFTFYIPEYILSENNWEKGLYSYIQLNATYKGTNDSPITSTFKILLGDNVRKYYEGNGTSTKDEEVTEDNVTKKLSKEDLTISRNMHYTFDTEVTTAGTLALMQVKVSIRPWEEKSVDGDINPPNLNLSAINWQYKTGSGDVNRIYFWTNIANPYIETANVSVSKEGETAQTVNLTDVFEGIESPTGSNFHLFNEGNDLNFPYNGYFDLAVKPAYASGYTIVMIFNAGGLKRTITVTTPKP